MTTVGRIVSGLRWVTYKIGRGLNRIGWPLYNGSDMDYWTYRYGVAVAVTGDLKKAELDELCSKLRAQTGQRVDWYWMGGRGVIKCLGNSDRIRQMIPTRSGIQTYPFN